jgi:Cadherin-like/Secretion system C-terminal sorting domain
LSSANPVIIKNDTLGVPPSGTNRIYLPNLVVTDADNLPSELEFTIVTNTAHGQVKLGNQVLGVGGHFTMQDIINNSLTYTNTNAAAPFDYFTFSVDDGEGGFTGTPRFNLKMDPNANIILDASYQDENSEVFLYPNPATEQLNVVLGNGTGKAIGATLSDVQGRLVPAAVEGLGGSNLKLSVGNVLPGLYFLEVKTAKGSVTKKVVIE